MFPSGGIGPMLPENIVRIRLANEASRVGEESLFDTGAIGPLPPGNEFMEELRHASARPNAPTTSDGRVGTSDKLEREAWMTDYLPMSTNPQNALKPRKFRQGASVSTGVDASWFTVSECQATESVIPATANIPKPDPHCKLLQDAVAIRDERMMAVAVEYNKEYRRNESLLESHQRKRAKELAKAKRKSKKCKSSSSTSSSNDSSISHGRKKLKRRHHKKREKRKKKKSRGEEVVVGPTRQPFDRDRDFFVSQMDPLKRRSIIERSKNLGSRFVHGGQKFL